ncbi:hypothetical protein Mal4_35310 [Maioricimonas rarisocia]|uniref:Uncharacterized protein n=1 Tax=Maioricimonas rarisocia TaxID=2528026 RepID=A0A517Z9N2_9PLAN|nr:hypothetical protein [Maioricimonas rarisocia]QDU39194.1 hypothetical protein Mal4_35310 [Maioricimonas rarisocia]
MSDANNSDRDRDLDREPGNGDEKSSPDPATVRRSLPHAIIAVVAARYLCQIHRFYPGAIESNEGNQLFEELLSRLTFYFALGGLPVWPEYMPRPTLASPDAEQTLDWILNALLSWHPDWDDSRQGRDAQTAWLQKVVNDADGKCEPEVRRLSDRVIDIAVVDCRIPSPRDDASFQTPQRSLRMLMLYWHRCRTIVMNEVDAPIGARPHGLLDLIVNLKVRLTHYCDLLSSYDGIPEVKRTILDLLSSLIEGDFGDLSVAPDWTRTRVQQVENILQTLRLTVGGHDDDLTLPEQAFLTEVDRAVREYGVRLQREWDERLAAADRAGTLTTANSQGTETGESAASGKSAPSDAASSKGEPVDSCPACGGERTADDRGSLCRQCRTHKGKVAELWRAVLFHDACLKRGDTQNAERAWSRLRSLGWLTLRDAAQRVLNSTEEGEKLFDRIRGRLTTNADEWNELLDRPLGDLLPLVESSCETSAPAGDRDGDAGEPVEEDTGQLQYVTLDQCAALVGRTKDTLYRWLRKDPHAPEPDVEGGGGKHHEFLWSRIRPWLENKSGRRLPERFPVWPR